MGELLSQSEIETLFPTTKTPRAPRLAAMLSVEQEPAEATSWEPFDVREPKPLSRDAVELLQAVHVGLCQNLARRFQTLLNAPVKFHPVSLIQAHFGNSASGASSDDLIFQIVGPSQSSPWLISWPSALARPLITRLLGGTSAASDHTRAEVSSEIDARLLNRLCTAVCEEIWWMTEPNSLDRPLDVRIVTRSEQTDSEFAETSYLCASFEITCDRDCGIMHCWLPGRQLIATAHCELSDKAGGLKSGTLAEPARLATVELAVDLARFKLRVSEITGLAIGDVLMSDVTRDDGATLRLANRPIFQVGLGTHHDRMAVCLLSSPKPTATSVSTEEIPKNR